MLLAAAPAPAAPYVLGIRFPTESSAAGCAGLVGAVAASDTIVVAGAPAEGSEHGGVYVFDAATGDLDRILASSRHGDLFGAAVAVSGTSVAVGAPGALGQSGAVYVFDGSTGALLLTLASPTPAADDRFGLAVATLGTNLVVGEPSAARVHVFDGATGALVRTVAAPGGTPIDFFGAALATVGNGLVVGAPLADHGAGAAFVLDSAGTLLRTLHAAAPAAGTFFGSAVASAGGQILIGAPGDLSGVPAGAVYAFDAVSGAALGTLVQPVADAVTIFGASVAALGSRALVGAPGGDARAYVFDTIAGGFGTLVQVIASPRGLGGSAGSAVGFGSAVAALGESLLIADSSPASMRVYRFDPCVGACTPVCGNGLIEPGEACDTGPGGGDDCNPDCTAVIPIPLTCDTNPTCPPACACKTDAECDDHQPCNGVETCASCDGCFLHHWSCCDAGTICAPGTPLADGSPCDDGNVCTAPDLCHAGVCVAGSDVCHLNTPVCAGRPDGTVCGNGSACHTADTCHGGACVPGGPPPCFDGAACAVADATQAASCGVAHRVTRGLARVGKMVFAAQQSATRRHTALARRRLASALHLLDDIGAVARRARQACAPALRDALATARTRVSALAHDVPACVGG